MIPVEFVLISWKVVCKKNAKNFRFSAGRDRFSAGDVIYEHQVEHFASARGFCLIRPIV